VQECAVPIDGAERLLVSVIGAPPAGIEKPVVLVDPDHYDVEVYQGQDCARKDCNQVDRFCYVYKSKDPGQGYLKASEGQAIAERRLELLSMDILERQDAWSTVYLTRNANLVPEQPTAKPFVYQTPQVQFPAPLSPTISSSAPIPIAEIPSAPSPITRSLEEHLQALFHELLKKNQEPKLLIQVEVTYEHKIHFDLAPVALPLLMQAPLEVEIVGGIPAEMISQWRRAIELWFSTYVPSAGGGTLWFDLTIMSNLTKQPMPLLRLNRLYLPLEYIRPPLKTRDVKF